MLLLVNIMINCYLVFFNIFVVMLHFHDDFHDGASILNINGQKAKPNISISVFQNFDFYFIFPKRNKPTSWLKIYTGDSASRIGKIKKVFNKLC